MTSALNLKYNALEVVDFANCSILVNSTHFSLLLELFKKYSDSIKKLILAGI